MNHNASTTSDTRPISTWLLWLAIVVIGGAFFYVGHDFRVSSFADYAPWSDSSETLQSGGNVLKGLALSLIGFLGIYLLLRRDGRPLRFTGWLPAAIAFYLAWSAASILWSSDPGLSCRKFAVLMFCALGALGLARQFRPRDIAFIAVVVPASYLAIGVLAELALGTFHPFSAGYRFAGTVHPNTQGVMLTTLCLASYCLARFRPRDDGRSRRWLWALFAIGIVFLLLTKSRTSCAALAVSMAALWMIGQSGRTRLLAVAALGFICCSAVLAGTLLGPLLDLDADDTVSQVVMLGRQEESSELTGRLPVWRELLRYVAERPLQGYGYESFWIDDRIEAISDELAWPLREAHNAYLDSTLGVGLIGTAALISFVLLGLCRSAGAFRSTGDVGAALTFCLLIFSVFNACLETGLISPNFIMLVICSGIAQLLACQPATRQFSSPCHAAMRGTANSHGLS